MAKIQFPFSISEWVGALGNITDRQQLSRIIDTQIKYSSIPFKSKRGLDRDRVREAKTFPLT